MKPAEEYHDRSEASGGLQDHDLCKARWGMEVFFKQIERTLQLADFLGNSERAIRWQVWTALLTYVQTRVTEHEAKSSSERPRKGEFQGVMGW